jgi:hypothetical protein
MESGHSKTNRAFSSVGLAPRLGGKKQHPLGRVRRVVIVEIKLALHLLNDRAEHLARFVTVSGPELDTPDGPVGVGSRLRLYPFDQYTGKAFALRLYRCRDGPLQTPTRYYRSFRWEPCHGVLAIGSLADTTKARVYRSFHGQARPGSTMPAYYDPRRFRVMSS